MYVSKGSVRWNFFKAIALVFLLINVCGLSISIVYPLVKYDDMVQDAMISYEHRGFMKKAWSSFWGFTWQGVSKEQEARRKVDREIKSMRFGAVAYFAVSVFLTWLAFDWQYAKYLVSTAVCILLEVLYQLLPIDVLPDWLPVAGVADDILVNFIGVGFGLATFSEFIRKRRIAHDIKLVMKDSPEAALKIACDEFNLSLESKKPK